MMELKKLSDEELWVFLEAFRALEQQGNRVALDMFCIIEREMLWRHESTPIAEYQDKDLVVMMEALRHAIDSARANGASDDSPALQFLLENITTLIEEAEQRGLIKQTQ